jgi:hypothetical protein
MKWARAQRLGLALIALGVSPVAAQSQLPSIGRATVAQPSTPKVGEKAADFVGKLPVPDRSQLHLYKRVCASLGCAEGNVVSLYFCA